MTEEVSGHEQEKLTFLLHLQLCFRKAEGCQSTGLACVSTTTCETREFCFFALLLELCELFELLPSALPLPSPPSPIHQYVDSIPGSAPPSCSPMLLIMVTQSIAARTRSGGISALVASSALHERGVVTTKEAGNVKDCCQAVLACRA